MKYRYYCCVNEDDRVIDLLKTKNLKYRASEAHRFLSFEVFSDMKDCEDFLSFLRTIPGTTIRKSSVFSDKEMEDASWYLFYVSRMGMDTSNVEFTYNARCRYTTIYGIKKCHHLDQINPFVSKKTPKWKNGYQFCSTETGWTTKIFCSDLAKETIKKSGINGVEFMPVLKGDLKTETPDVSQLVFPNKLPREAFEFIGAYHKEVCPYCGEFDYVFDEPACDNVRLNIDLVPAGIDAFGSEMLFGPGFGEEFIVISKKFYNLIFNELKEKKGHAILYPIA